MKRKIAGAFVLGLCVGGVVCVAVLKHTERIVQDAMVVRQDDRFVTIQFNHDPSDQTLRVRIPVSRDFPCSGGQKVPVAFTGYQWHEYDGQTDELMQTNAFDLERKAWANPTWDRE